MAIYDTRLVRTRQVATGTTEFIMDKPAGLDYRAGQFFDIILPPATPDADKMTHVHGFSFVSAPYEDTIAAATRMRNSPFKNALAKVADGTPIKVEAVWGEFTLRKKEIDTPAVFITGGVGITPVLSIVKQATHDKSPQKLTLIFANRSPDYAPFVPELKALAKANPNFTFVETYTRTPSSDPAAGKGRVTAELVQRHVPDIAAPNFYLSGPAGMVRSSRELLVGMGVDEDNIRTEEFEGY